MAVVIPIGQPVNDTERRVIGFLRDNLPATWQIYHNFELRQGKELFEIDLVLISAHAVYLVDVKGTQGTIEVIGPKWYPEGRSPFASPLAKLRSHARAFAGLMRDSNTGIPELKKAYVHACVILGADRAVIVDPDGRDKTDVINLKNCVKYFNDKSIIPGGFLDSIQPFFKPIAGTITGKAKVHNKPLAFGNWQVEERLGGSERYTEYRAKNLWKGRSGGMVRLRVYDSDPYQSEEDRKKELSKISNAFRAVDRLPSHSNILTVRDFFLEDSENKAVLVTEELSGQSLRLHITRDSAALSFDQKLEIMKNILSGLDHAHKHEVIHRNLTPDAILVTREGQARITDFDYARVGKNRTSTIAGLIVDELAKDDRELYQAIEVNKDPSNASIASDIYSAGVIFYEMLTGEKPFKSVEEMMEADSRFPILPSELKTDIPKGFDAWLQKFCMPDVEDRHISAAVAKKELETVIFPEFTPLPANDGQNNPQEKEVDVTKLQPDYILEEHFRIQKKLGSGSFGVVYQVFDVMGDIVRALKLITRDRQSVYERLLREYRALVDMPPHPNVVKVIWADRLHDSERTPFIVFEYLDGFNVSEMLEAKSITLEDSMRILKEAAAGLLHLHSHGVYHQDIKPSNLMWTDKGLSIIDFNIAVQEHDLSRLGGGTRRYLPPDLDYTLEPDAADRIDRDLYALGITVYECITGGSYPFDDPTSSARVQPKDPRQFSGCRDLSDSLVNMLLKMIAPNKANRFTSAGQLLEIIGQIGQLKTPLIRKEVLSTTPKNKVFDFSSKAPNTNQFVSYLLTLYSQSQYSNAGTRGLDDIGKTIYVETYLDQKLQPALYNADFRLVIISGNAGDGKTAFIQQFESKTEKKGGKIERYPNGAMIKFNGHTYISNYDGSQDEGDIQNDAVLDNFFTPFKGELKNITSLPNTETHLIAINEGRLVDFFRQHSKNFPALSVIIDSGLKGAENQNGIAIINLNLRSVVAEGDGGNSILERLIKEMSREEYWTSCTNCDIYEKCYACYNAATFRNSVAGPKVIERLKMLFLITHLRGNLHITMRDLRSVLAVMFAGKIDCKGIHELYQNGGEDSRNKILNSYYFSAIFGGSEEDPKDRLISLFKEIDIAQVSNPVLDLELSFINSKEKPLIRYPFDNRFSYDEELFNNMFQSLPRDYSSKNRKELIEKHQAYLAHVRRRHFFESRDSQNDRAWGKMLPYSHCNHFIDLIKRNNTQVEDELFQVLKAINRGEGLSDPSRLGNQLALRIRLVEKGTIKSYRVFRGKHFSLECEYRSGDRLFFEYMPQALYLVYDSENAKPAKLKINLDIFEMLMRLNDGYEASIEEQQGFYLSLSVFKNMLSAAPYQEVLLTETGYRFYRINREEDGVLYMSVKEQEADYNAG
jgi:serine/threonine protein kinase